MSSNGCRKIAQGGEGEVWKGRIRGQKGDVAVKLAFKLAAGKEQGGDSVQVSMMLL